MFSEDFVKIDGKYYCIGVKKELGEVVGMFGLIFNCLYEDFNVGDEVEIIYLCGLFFFDDKVLENLFFVFIFVGVGIIFMIFIFNYVIFFLFICSIFWIYGVCYFLM